VPEAGLVDRSAHGSLKAAARYLAERGASTHALMAIFGWRTLKQAQLYTEAADCKRLALDHNHQLSRTNSAGNFSTLGMGKRRVGKKTPKK
jgi:hypothetical protein